MGFDLNASKAYDEYAVKAMFGDREAGKSGFALQDWQRNPEKYTTSQPNTASKPAFTIGSYVGAGRDGLRKGASTNYYLASPKSAESAGAAAETKPEPTVEQAAPPVINNVYQSEIDDLQKQLDDRPDFTVELARIQQDYQSQIAAQATQQRNYLNNLQIQQNTRLDTMAADQQRKSDELAAGQRTYQQNQARSGQLGALQIGGAAETPRTGGTQGFKRRKLQINPATANALSGILGGTTAATKTNVLNV